MTRDTKPTPTANDKYKCVILISKAMGNILLFRVGIILIVGGIFASVYVTVLQMPLAILGLGCIVYAALPEKKKQEEKKDDQRQTRNDL